MMAFGVVSFNVECRKQAYNDTGRFLETRPLEKKKVRSQELIIKPRTYRTVSEHRESLMVEGRVGNKWDSASTRPETLFKVDVTMPLAGKMVGNW